LKFHHGASVDNIATNPYAFQSDFVERSPFEENHSKYVFQNPTAISL